MEMNKQQYTQEATAPGSDMRAHNLIYAARLKNLAWFIEIVLVSVGLGIAFAQAVSIPNGSGLVQTFPVFGVFLVLAVVELAKIPAATVVFHAKSWHKLLPLVGLLVASLISFETIFNGFERYAQLNRRMRAMPLIAAMQRLPGSGCSGKGLRVGLRRVKLLTVASSP
jgi:hypothetical protein